MELEECLEVIEFLDEREKRSSQLIRQLAQESEDCRLLMSIAGIGYHHALFILAEIGDMSWFSNGDKYASYCGVEDGALWASDPSGQSLAGLGVRGGGAYRPQKESPPCLTSTPG